MIMLLSYYSFYNMRSPARVMCLFMKKLRAAAMELSVNPMLAYIKHLRD
jgi:hypothetical protein